ncbi:MAG: sigma-70 family RNA polymerase sigma factor [Opitutus sp.]|nr:sigma-70 family RNA polymerase sigma factor [Opitutus sp.]
MDSTLLQRYATHRDEAAFAEVVRRHLHFVYSAALRRLGRDTHHAQDVAQLVFCALARDAGRIARDPVLSGWLYTATRNAVINVVRGEKRRRTREEEACQMQLIESESDVSTDWSKLRPVLDSAMDQLSARDREAVLLRFFQDRSFGEIGATVGLSEDAARKRIDRALAKLRDLLRPHGVASNSTALAALLASQPVSAVPAGLMASVTTAALSTGAATATGLTTFLTMTKLQAGGSPKGSTRWLQVVRFGSLAPSRGLQQPAG